MIQKIHELIKKVYPSTSLGDFGLKEQLCTEVAKATVEEACEWLKYNLHRFVHPDNMGSIYVSNTLFEKLHEAMEE